MERGAATIPLPGVDVPFHSTYLRGGVKGFRAVLAASLTEAAFAQVGMLSNLIGCYIPNLVALPFSLSKVFASEIFRRTGSPILAPLLASTAAWDALAATPPKLARILVIELLAYQFASPVQWIDTQEYFFTGRVALPRVASSDLLPPPKAFPTAISRSPALPSGLLRELGFPVGALEGKGGEALARASSSKGGVAVVGGVASVVWWGLCPH